MVFGILISEASRLFVLWGTKNAADLEMYVLSKCLNDVSIIYNWRVLSLRS